MMPHSSRARAVARLAAAAVALAATSCVSILPAQVTPLALFAPPADRAAAPSAPLEAQIAVYPPDSGRAFAGVDIAVSAGAEIVYLEAVRWADSPSRLLQTAALNALAKAKGDGRAAPAQLALRSDYDLRWRIVDLSVGRDMAPANCVVEASLADARSRRVVAQQRFSASVAPTSRAPRDRAAALTAALQQAADQTAQFVAEHAAAITPPAPARS